MLLRSKYPSSGSRLRLDYYDWRTDHKYQIQYRWPGQVLPVAFLYGLHSSWSWALSGQMMKDHSRIYYTQSFCVCLDSAVTRKFPGGRTCLGVSVIVGLFKRFSITLLPSPVNRQVVVLFMNDVMWGGCDLCNIRKNLWTNPNTFNS